MKNIQICVDGKKDCVVLFKTYHDLMWNITLMFLSLNIPEPDNHSEDNLQLNANTLRIGCNVDKQTHRHEV